MPSRSFSFFSTLALATAARATLAPRASPAPVTHYSVAFACPGGTALGSGVTTRPGFVLDAEAALIYCDYIANSSPVECAYSQHDGSMDPDSSDELCSTLQGLATASSDEACSLECPLADGSSDALSFVAADGADAFHCWYDDQADAGSLVYCPYSVKAGGTLTSGQDERCPAAVVDACQGGMNRRFRGEDNFTAWTQKRRSRKPLIPDAQPAMPTPTTPPFTIRLGGVLGKHRRIRNRF